METAIVVVWIVALLGALFLTAVAGAQIVRIVHHAREIDRLAREALPAAAGIAENTATIAALEGVLQTAGRLLAAAEALDRTTAAIAGRTATVRRALASRGES
jgi:hypothetical protein